MTNAERHAMFKRARATQLSVPVSAVLSFQYKWWVEAHPWLSLRDRDLAATRLIDTAPASVPITCATMSWRRGPLIVETGGQARQLPATRRGWALAAKLVLAG